MSREEEVLLVQRWQQRHLKKARTRLVEYHERTVRNIAYQYRNYGVPLDDLVSEGFLGLFVALDRFDVRRKVRLVTYASWWIKAYVGRYTMTQRISGFRAHPMERTASFHRVKRAIGRARSAYGDELAAVDIIMRDLEVDRSRAEYLVHAADNTAPMSLDRELADGLTGVDILRSHDAELGDALDEKDRQAAMAHLVAAAMIDLDARERRIVREYVMAPEKKTLAEIGRTFGISRERVRQIKKRAMKKIKAMLSSM